METLSRPFRSVTDLQRAEAAARKKRHEATSAELAAYRIRNEIAKGQQAPRMKQERLHNLDDKKNTRLNQWTKK